MILRFVVLLAVSTALLSCDKDSDRVYYGGKEYIMFTQPQNEYYVSVDTPCFIDIASTVACDYDRNVVVEVVNTNSTAIEGVHFDLESHNVTIKAGEYATQVKITGHYDELEPGDSLKTHLRLVIPESVQWDLYPENLETTVTFRKFAPFHIDDWFENEFRAKDPEKYNYANYIFYASFPYSDGSRFEHRLVKVYQDEADPERMIVKDPFGSGKDIKLRLHPGGPGENKVSMIPQEAFYASNYGWITMASMPDECYYNSCERFMTLNLNCYVDQLGTLGIYPYLLVWVSEHKAIDLRNSGRY